MMVNRNFETALDAASEQGIGHKSKGKRSKMEKRTPWWASLSVSCSLWKLEIMKFQDRIKIIVSF